MPAVTLVFAGHELDPRRQELRREGEVVHVEPQVFDLLTFLIRNRDRIVSKDEILDTIWDGRIVSEAALSSRINAARKAIGDSGNDQIFIRTFHKRGFRFVAEATELSDNAAPPDGHDGARPQAEALAAALPAAAPVASDQEHGKPSIAVVPFPYISQDSEHEYFAYGLTEDVVRLLGRNRWLTVMTRHTTAPDRRAEVDARALGAALGVRYLVEGSVRRHGERVRITAGLVAAETGTQLWSEVYDLHLADIFDIQDAMAKQIAAVIEPELASHEQEIAHRKAPESLDAWDCYQRGFYHLWGFTTPGFAAGRGAVPPRDRPRARARASPRRPVLRPPPECVLWRPEGAAGTDRGRHGLGPHLGCPRRARFALPLRARPGLLPAAALRRCHRGSGGDGRPQSELRTGLFRTRLHARLVWARGRGHRASRDGRRAEPARSAHLDIPPHPRLRAFRARRDEERRLLRPQGEPAPERHLLDFRDPRRRARAPWGGGGSRRGGRGAPRQEARLYAGICPRRPVLLRRPRIHRTLPRRSRPRRGAGLSSGWRLGVGCGRFQACSRRWAGYRILTKPARNSPPPLWGRRNASASPEPCPIQSERIPR